MTGPKVEALPVLIVCGCAYGFIDLSALPRNRLAVFLLRMDER